MKITISLLAFTIPKVTLEGEVAPRRVFGWALRSLPGHRYQKLLMRMTLAEAQYERMVLTSASSGKRDRSHHGVVFFKTALRTTSVTPASTRPLRAMG